MAHAETCPLCKGNGYADGQFPDPCGTGSTCHGCCDKGWVSVQDEVVSWPVYPSYGTPYSWQTSAPRWWSMPEEVLGQSGWKLC